MDKSKSTLLQTMYQKSLEDIRTLKIQRELETRKIQVLEKKLLQEANLFETCFESSLSPMAILDTEFNFVKVNQAYAQLDEKLVSDFPGRNHFDLYPSDAKAIFENVLKSKASFSVKNREFYYETNPKKGATFWDYSLFPIMDEQNEVRQLLLTLIDVTDKVRNFEELNYFFNLAPDGFMMIDFDGWVKKINEACCKILNISSGNLKEINFFQVIKALLSMDNYAVFKKMFHKILSGVPIQQYELPYLEQEGKGKWLLLRMVACPERKMVFVAIKDISDQMAANEELKNNARLFDDILNSVSVGFMSIDSNWKLKYINKTAIKNSNKSRQELLDKNIWEIYPEYKNTPLFQAFHVVMKGASHVSLQSPGVDSDNYYETHVYHSKDGITVYFRDISESKRLEEELYTNEKRMETLLKLSQMEETSLEELVAFALMEGVKLTSSDIGWLGILNEDQSEANYFLWEDNKSHCYTIKNNDDSLFPIPGVEFFWQVVNMRRPFIVKESKGNRIGRTKGNISKLDNRIVIPIYQDRRITLVGGVANKKDGYQKIDVKQFTLLLSGVWKVMQKRHMEQKLKESEERFYKIFELNPSGVALKQYENGVYCEINKNFEALTGFSREEVLGKTPVEINIINADVMSDCLNQIKNTGFCKNQEIKIITKAGEEKTILTSMEVIEINRQKLVISVFHDITERKRMEREMAKLDRLNSIGQMSAGISHEIRNPLSVVRGFLQLLSEKEDLTCYGEEFGLMIGELDRANKIISEFLSLARNKQIDLQSHDLNAIIEHLFPLLQADAMIREQVINLELSGIPNLLLDEKEIRQLILNMSRNGLEAMDSGQVLTIRTFYVDGGVVLSISDQGKGIAPEVMEKLGTPFFSTKEEGTGLGLAICYGIVDRHNAAITIDTSAAGTTFWVQFTQI